MARPPSAHARGSGLLRARFHRRSAWGLGEDRRASFAPIAPHLVLNHRTHARFVAFRAEKGSGPPPYEDFVRFGLDLAQLIRADVTDPEARVDIVAHSMGGLDTVAAVALLDDHSEFDVEPLRCVEGVITFDTAFVGFAAAGNPEWAALRRRQGRGGPEDQAQGRAMQEDSLQIESVQRVRDAFLGNIAGFWPRGADNAGGLIEVPPERASYGNAGNFAPELRPRTAAIGPGPEPATRGLPRDPRAIVAHGHSPPRPIRPWRGLSRSLRGGKVPCSLNA